MTLDISVEEEARAEELATDPLLGGLVVPRLLGRVGDPRSGPTLVCVGGLHGNEPAGVLALQRIFAKLGDEPEGFRGQLVGLAGNRRALAKRARYLEHDLNRHWLPERVERLRRAEEPLEAEDLELVELDRTLDEIFAEAEGGVVCLDLHTFSGPGHCFVTLDDALVNREFALRFPAPLVLGLEEELAGTLSNHFTAQGIVNIGFESGQHDEPAAVDRAEEAIWIALEVVGVVAPGSRPEVGVAHARLDADADGYPDVVEVRYRHEIKPEDEFLMEPGFRGLEPIKAGQVLAEDRRGEVRSPTGGLLLMPLYQKQGADGFFVTRAVSPAWLRISATVRRWHVERFVHLLPGVKRHPDQPNTFIVDRRYARFLALEVFHLLGFRRQAMTERYLTMTRRADYRD